jgi:hypothetical protein
VKTPTGSSALAGDAAPPTITAAAIAKAALEIRLIVPVLPRCLVSARSAAGLDSQGILPPGARKAHLG